MKASLFMRAAVAAVWGATIINSASLIYLAQPATASLPAPARAVLTSSGGGCPDAPYVSCVQMPANTSMPMTGQEISAGANSDPGTPWMVTDASGAPMAWVNLYGLYSGGLGGKMVGGLVCVTYGVKYSVACLTPEGTLTLQPTGPDGPTGAAATLTARDLRFVHCLEAHAISYCRSQP